MPLPCITLPRKNGWPDCERSERVAGQQAVGLDLHRRVEVVEEVVVGDVDVRAELVDGRRGAAVKSESSVMNASTDCEGIVKCWRVDRSRRRTGRSPR